MPFHSGLRGKGRQTQGALATFTGKRMEVDVMLKLDRYTGLADTYDTYRPCPPVVIPDMLIRLARIPRPRLVVDLGCGTGLSTFIWVDCAEAVVGIVALKGQHRRGMVHADCNV